MSQMDAFKTPRSKNMSAAASWSGALFDLSSQPVDARWCKNIIDVSEAMQQPERLEHWQALGQGQVQVVPFKALSHLSVLAPVMQWSSALLECIQEGAALVSNPLWKGAFANTYDPTHTGNTLLHALSCVPSVLVYATHSSVRYERLIQELCEQYPQWLQEPNAYGYTPLQLSVEYLNPIAGKVLMQHMGMKALHAEHPDSDGGHSFARLSAHIVDVQAALSQPAAVSWHMLGVYARLLQHPMGSGGQWSQSAVLEHWKTDLNQWVLGWIQKDKKCTQALKDSGGLDARVQWLRLLEMNPSNQKRAQDLVIGWLQAYANAWGESAAVRIDPVLCVKTTMLSDRTFGSALCPEEFQTVDVRAVSKKSGNKRTNHSQSWDEYTDVDDIQGQDNVWDGLGLQAQAHENGYISALQEVYQKQHNRWDKIVPLLCLAPECKAALLQLSARWEEKLKLERLTPQKSPALSTRKAGTGRL